MLRKFHRYPGVIAALFVVFTAVTGAVLSILPTVQFAGTPDFPPEGLSIAALAGRIAENYPAVEKIQKTPSGKIIAYTRVNDQPASILIDPITGKGLSNFAPSAFGLWIKDLHRAFLVGRKGRALAGVSAFAMLALSISGAILLAHRMGGWKRIFSRVRGGRWQRLHVIVARVIVVGLLLSAATGGYMSLVTFGYVADGMIEAPMFPAAVDGGSTIPVGDVTTLQRIDVSQLRELVFPFPDDPTDVYTLSSATGDGFIDQATGQMLSWMPLNTHRRIFEFIYMLHTGKGLWWVGLLLGIASLGVPIMAASGIKVWWGQRRATPKIRNNSNPQAADTIILVGSESGNTWGFARTMHEALTKTGHRVYTGPMGGLLPKYRTAERMFIFAATYGDGDVPQSAKGFVRKLEKIKKPPFFPVAVLGFGDRQFPGFCQFAVDTDRALAANGWNIAVPMETIDRQSVQQFRRWGTEMVKASGEDIILNHVPVLPKTNALKLQSRTDYGAEVQAPTSVLRFSLPKVSLFRRLFTPAAMKFAAGDLVGILAPGHPVPRFYSLASSSRDGSLEICVRKHPGGVCSTHLHNLEIGDEIAAFIKPNPEFRPARGKKPVILIGAGTGIGPLAGFIRANKNKRPMHLYFGARDPQSDFLYEVELNDWQASNRLTGLQTAFSRVVNKAYVQDAIRQDAENLRQLIADGAQILVCGGRGMAAGAMEALADVMAPMNLQPATLKARGRYTEDVY